MRFLLPIVLASCATWTGADTAREIVYGTATVLDWGQTQRITAACSEANPLIGQCGRGIGPGIYFPVMLVAHVLVSAGLPRGWREAWQYLGIGSEGGTVLTNWEAGWGL